MSTRKKCLLIVSAALALGGFASSIAAEYDAEFRAGIGVSDNVTRVAQGEVDETIATAGLSLSATEQTRKLDLALSLDIDYLDYLDDTYDSEYVGGLNGIATFNIVDERLQWVIQDTYGQQLLDPLAPARPDNREDVNYFTTGPTFSFLPGSRSPVQIEARYSRVNFEERPSDNDRLSGALSVGRDTGRDTTISLNLTAERVEFDDGAAADRLDSASAYIRYEKAGNRTTVSADLGYNEVESGGFEGDGLLLNVDVSRQTSANGTLALTASSSYSDQGDIFRLLQDTTGDLRETADGVSTEAPFQHNFLALSYVIAQERYGIDLSTSFSEEDFEGGVGLDRDVFRSDARFTREISRRVFVRADIRFARREFKYLDRRDDDLVLGVTGGYRFMDGVAVSLEYQHFQRNSITVGADFTENRAFLRLEYIPVWSRR